MSDSQSRELHGEGGPVRYSPERAYRPLVSPPSVEDKDACAIYASVRKDATPSHELAAERNVSSAAAALGVSRRTVANRLRTVEERIGRPLGAAMMEIDAALRLDELGESIAPSRSEEESA